MFRNCLILAVGAIAHALIHQPANAAAPKQFHVTTLSSSPNFVSGGDALLQVDTAAPVTVSVGQKTFKGVAAQAAGRTVQRVLVDGLPEGPVFVTVRGGGSMVRYRLVNHPAQGPLFSGPHQKPFVCETAEFKLPNGATLGPAKTAQCSAPTDVQFVYMSTIDAKLKPLAHDSLRPDDMATTITSSGRTVDYVVRLETGVINRAIYQIAVLASLGERTVRFDRPPAEWNGRLIYAFGGGCGAAYHQGRGTGGVINNPEMGNDALARGYALASATLNVLGANCNDVTSSETVAMVREHFIEQFGPPVHTIGLGGSGGSMQQNLTAENYPGLLDGLILGRSFPDTLSVLVAASDCVLLQRYFGQSKLEWSDAQKTAVTGYPSFAHCTKAWGNYLPRWILSDGAGCDSTAFLTAQEAGPLANTAARSAFGLYNAKTNPTGVRCGYFDNAVNIWGRKADGSTQFPLDNEGVQYGLKAYRAGLITFEQYLDLNRNIGGFRNNGEVINARTRADPQALTIAYRTGRINLMARLGSIPIVDVRSYVDKVAPDVHLAYTTQVARARHLRADGHAGAFISWTTPTLGSLREDLTRGDSPLREAMRQALAGIDRWLDKVAAAPRAGAGAVIEAKPVGMVDGCWIEGRFIAWNVGDGARTCNAAYPPGADPRLVAGEPIERITLKCATRPVVAGDALGADSRALAAIFPRGVCNYAAPPIGLRPNAKWVLFGENELRPTRPPKKD
jgi:hypothetical protein